MTKKITSVAFDLGGVLAGQNKDLLSDEEKFLLNLFFNRNNPRKMQEYYLHYGKDHTMKMMELAREHMKEIYLKIHYLNPDTIKTLQLLKEQGITPTIWTNNIDEIDCWLRQSGLYDYIDPNNVVNSIKLGSDKPDKNFYYKALSQTKRSAEEVLFIDDSAKNVMVARECTIPSQIYSMSESDVNLDTFTLEEVEKINRKL